MASVYMEQRKGKDYWWLETNLLPRKKYLGSASRMTKKQAEEVCKEWEAKEQLGKSGIAVIEPAARPKRVMTYSEFLPQLLTWRATVYSAAGHEHFTRHCKTALPYFGNLTIADDVATIDLWNTAFNAWQVDRLKVVSPETVKDEWKDIKASLYRAARTGGKKEGNRWNLCQTSPVGELVIASNSKTVKKKIKIFTAAELDKLYQVNPAHAAFWKFIANTGLRRKELSNLRKQDIIGSNHKRRVLVDHDLEEGMDTKTGKARSIPLNSDALAAYFEILTLNLPGDRLLPDWRQDRWSKVFTVDKSAAGIKSSGTLHGLRHTFISDCVNNGVAIHLAMKWAGHSKLETTLRYLDVPEDYEWVEMDKMEETRTRTEAAVSNVVSLTARRA